MYTGVLRIVVVSLATPLWLSSQTVVNGGRTIVGPWNASGASATSPAKTGSTPPATCSLGEQFFKTDAPAGQNLYFCTAVNTWTQMSGGGGAGLPPQAGKNGQVLTTDGTDASWAVPRVRALKTAAPNTTVTGSTDTELGYYIIPAGLLQTGDAIEIALRCTHTTVSTGATNKCYATFTDSTMPLTPNGTHAATSTWNFASGTVYILNGSASAPQGYYGTSANSQTARQYISGVHTVDPTTALRISIRGFSYDADDQVTLDWYVIKVVKNASVS